MYHVLCTVQYSVHVEFRLFLVRLFYPIWLVSINIMLKFCSKLIMVAIILSYIVFFFSFVHVDIEGCIDFIAF